MCRVLDSTGYRVGVGAGCEISILVWGLEITQAYGFRIKRTERFGLGVGIWGLLVADLGRGAND